jgi:hypothetical protein
MSAARKRPAQQSAEGTERSTKPRILVTYLPAAGDQKSTRFVVPSFALPPEVVQRLKRLSKEDPYDYCIDDEADRLTEVLNEALKGHERTPERILESDETIVDAIELYHPILGSCVAA